MRIAFLGKGGSGKTTTAAGFARFLAARFPFVLAVDADVNAHFKTALGLEGDTLHLESHFDQVIAHLRGKRSDLGDRMMLATTPPSLLSTFIRPTAEDELIKRYALFDGSLALLTVGQYRASDLGGSCYHTKLFGLAAVLHHMLDGQNDFVVADTTAGTDNLATSLWFAYDMNVFVVEPTAKSVSVYRDFIGVSPELAEKTFVVGNKVEGEEDEEFIRDSVADGRYLGSIPLSRHLKRFEQGKAGALEAFRKEQEGPFQAVLDALQDRQRDWPGYLARLRETHARTCRDWFNEFYGMQLDIDLDPDFTYEKVMTANGSGVGSSDTAGDACLDVLAPPVVNNDVAGAAVFDQSGSPVAPGAVDVLLNEVAPTAATAGDALLSEEPSRTAPVGAASDAVSNMSVATVVATAADVSSQSSTDVPPANSTASGQS
ncbi:MAG: hypothetical protein SGJ27_08875 [Candidatus Melainabacteria bacterium]|nr:hypothetical protein [Candidatus Melainabacteria bacterium]